MEFNHNDFKKCLGSFTSGVTIITLVDASNDPQGVTISSFTSLSLEPPMVAFNLGKASYLHNKFLNSDSFAVNILSAGQMPLSRQFAESKGERWHGINYTLSRHGCPLLDEASAYIECLTDKIYDGGDHSIITGKVVGLKSTEKPPLVYYMGAYWELGKKV